MNHMNHAGMGLIPEEAIEVTRRLVRGEPVSNKELQDAIKALRDIRAGHTDLERLAKL